MYCIGEQDKANNETRRRTEERKNKEGKHSHWIFSLPSTADLFNF
jgi:hypothetical protein